MNAAHTSGPWKLQGGRSIVTDSGTFYLSYGEDKDGNPNGKASWCELDANARLAAAAPALFEACNMLLSECTTDEARRYMTRKYGEAHWREAVRAGYAALAAARGE